MDKTIHQADFILNNKIYQVTMRFHASAATTAVCEHSHIFDNYYIIIIIIISLLLLLYHYYYYANKM